MNEEHNDTVNALIRKYSNKAMKLRAILRDAKELPPVDSCQMQLDARDHERTIKDLHKLFLPTED